MWFCSLNNTFKYNTRSQTAKVYRSFDPHLHLGGLKAPQRPQLIGPLSKAKLSCYPDLICKSWHLCELLIERSFNFESFWSFTILKYSSATFATSKFLSLFLKFLFFFVFFLCRLLLSPSPFVELVRISMTNYFVSWKISFRICYKNLNVDLDDKPSEFNILRSFHNRKQ